MKLAYSAYTCSAIALVLLMVGCESPNSAAEKERITVLGHPTACVESLPVVPEDVMKGITKGYDYKIANEENNRSRCFDYDSSEYACKSKANDTLYIIDTYCPATLKARAELGGN
jgi:uncharacterized membrane-anchored protein